MKFIPGRHLNRVATMVTVFDDKNKMLATITPGEDGQSFRILSKYLEGVQVDRHSPPPVVHVQLRVPK